jgi:predicted Zn finger-like uncharacterized protein
MILSCPACQTRYLVDDEAFSSRAERTVRCANCGHTWNLPSPPERRPNDEPIKPEDRIEPALELPPRPGSAAAPSFDLPLRARPVPDSPSGGRRSRWAALRWLVLAVLCALAVLAGIVVARGAVVAIWPASTRLYSLAGLPVPAPEAKLKVDKLTPIRTPDGLIIEGDIVNPGKTPQDVPQLRVALRDGADKDVQFKIVAPPIARLAPGASAHFKTPLDHPDAAATDVAVTFVKR